MKNNQKDDLNKNLKNKTNNFEIPTDKINNFKIKQKESIEDKSLKDITDKYLRLMAEFDNFKKRTNREKIEMIEMASKNVIISLLPILDDFERSFKSIKDDNDKKDIFYNGIKIIYEKLQKILKNHGLEPIQSLGMNFDDNLHEALTNIKANSNDLKNKIVDELEKGYFLNKKIIRFSKVVVGI
ncbi:MAG: nucleotide exchange factor GrpE [Bacteroides sp.]|nr:MAG: nucleotide exchange factor GrpE [Bacteroides sp.]